MYDSRISGFIYNIMIGFSEFIWLLTWINILLCDVITLFRIKYIYICTLYNQYYNNMRKLRLHNNNNRIKQSGKWKTVGALKVPVYDSEMRQTLCTLTISHNNTIIIIFIYCRCDVRRFCVISHTRIELVSVPRPSTLRRYHEP